MNTTQDELPKRLWRRAAEGDYFSWRTKVLARDGNRCQGCGVEGGPRGRGLHAHHVLGYAERPDLRYEVDNGMALCMTCHRKLHTKEVSTDPIACACGCGTMIAPFDIHKRPRRYVNGHAMRGVEKSAATCAAISASKRGKTQTAESNRKRSETQKGKIVTDETRRKMSAAVSRWRREMADKIILDGRSMSLADWADETSIPYERLWRRLNNGWSVERALTTPVRPKRR